MKPETVKFFDDSAATRDSWRKKNWYYHDQLFQFFSFIIPRASSILEIGCSTGSLLGRLNSDKRWGIDISPGMIAAAKSAHPEIHFSIDDIEDLKLNQRFDYILMQDLIGHLTDVWTAFRNLKKVTSPGTRVLITYYNHLWEPIILLLEFLGLKAKQPCQNWLSLDDIENLLYLNGYEVIKKGHKLLLPLYIPFLSDIVNKYLAKLPLIRNLCLMQYVIAKEIEAAPLTKAHSVSVIIPCRNEAGNIGLLVEKIPKIGSGTEIIFVDGDSTDGTVERIKGAIAEYPQKNISLIHQNGAFGKADAVRKGFDAAAGDIFMIYDADITVPPEDLNKFYLALAEGKGEFINGSRLVYPMEKGSMRTLNMLGNKIFSLIFTWILEQRINDTLCGTKVLFKTDYEKIKRGRKYFGDFDPFGDFDLLFGASKLNLKIVELPISYKERKYGITKISRFRHGLLLFKMSFIALEKIKFHR